MSEICYDIAKQYWGLSESVVFHVVSSVFLDCFGFVFGWVLVCCAFWLLK